MTTIAEKPHTVHQYVLKRGRPQDAPRVPEGQRCAQGQHRPTPGKRPEEISVDSEGQEQGVRSQVAVEDPNRAWLADSVVSHVDEVLLTFAAIITNVNKRSLEQNTTIKRSLKQNTTKTFNSTSLQRVA